ncbi:hypothetical protein AC579_790, partial [Pseudocercospora musae]
LPIRLELERHERYLLPLDAAAESIRMLAHVDVLTSKGREVKYLDRHEIAALP